MCFVYLYMSVFYGGCQQGGGWVCSPIYTTPHTYAVVLTVYVLGLAYNYGLLLQDFAQYLVCIYNSLNFFSSHTFTAIAVVLSSTPTIVFSSDQSDLEKKGMSPPSDRYLLNVYAYIDYFHTLCTVRCSGSSQLSRPPKAYDFGSYGGCSYKFIKFIIQ